MVLRTHKCGNCELDFQTIELGIDQPEVMVGALMAWARHRGLRPESLTLYELEQMMTAGNHQQGDAAHRPGHVVGR
jgi:hypothetical protein